MEALAVSRSGPARSVWLRQTIRRYTRDFAEIARAEWRAAGIRKMYGYQVDVASEPRWTRNRTTFGEGPQLNASIISVIVKGFQGKQLGPDSVAMTAAQALSRRWLGV